MMNGDPPVSAEPSRKTGPVPQDNPRQLGKDRTRLVGSVPRKFANHFARRRGRIHQLLWRRSRAAGDAKQELSGQEPGNGSEPGQVTRAGFRSAPIAVTQRVFGCYCVPARSGCLWRPRSREVSPTKDAERRDKRSVRAGKAAGQASP